MKVLLVLAVVCAVGVYGKVTPDYFPSCKRSDPQINKCILDAAEALKPMLKAGIPEVGIPPLDPFSVPTLKLNRTAQNLRIKATIANAKAYGGSNFKVQGIKVNVVNKYVGEVKLYFPKLKVTSDYDVRGSRILALDINGKGKLRANLTGITVVAKGGGKPITKDGVEYLQLDKVVAKVRITHGQIAFDETERPIAAASAATFFNASPNVVFDILSPLIDETTAAVAKAILNKLLSGVPLSDLLTE